MSKEQLGHIFERSACLTPKQMKGYVSGKMVHEEAHAVEVHLLSCPFCRDAMDGLRENQDKGALAGMEKLDAGFIAAHFGVSKDDLNIKGKKVKASKQGDFKTFTEKSGGESGGGIRRMWKPMAAAAGLIAVACILYFMRESIFPEGGQKQLAQNTETSNNTSVPEQATPDIAYRPVADSTVADTPIMAINETAEMMTLPPEDKPALEEKKPESAEEKKKQEQAQKEAEQKKKANAEMLTAAAAKPGTQTLKKPAKADDLSADYAEKRMGNSFTPEEQKDAPATTTLAREKAETKEPAPPKKINLGEARSGIPDGDEAFNDGKYKKALRQYKKIMFDPKSNQKDAATLMAAKCHIAEDEMMQARTLLNSLVKENSVKKDEAAALLKQLPKEE